MLGFSSIEFVSQPPLPNFKVKLVLDCVLFFFFGCAAVFPVSDTYLRDQRVELCLQGYFIQSFLFLGGRCRPPYCRNVASFPLNPSNLQHFPLANAVAIELIAVRAKLYNPSPDSQPVESRWNLICDTFDIQPNWNYWIHTHTHTRGSSLGGHLGASWLMVRTVSHSVPRPSECVCACLWHSTEIITLRGASHLSVDTGLTDKVTSFELLE